MMTFVNIMIVGEAFRFRMHGVLGDKLGVSASSFCISCKQRGFLERSIYLLWRYWSDYMIAVFEGVL